MRLPLIAPADLTPEQRPLYENMKAGIEKNFQGFKTIAENGSLLGPWNPWLHEPKFGKPIWDLTLALSISPSTSPLIPKHHIRRRGFDATTRICSCAER